MSTGAWKSCLAVRKLNGCWERRPCSLSEEADEPFDVLRSRRQKELLANKLWSQQARATECDLVLESRKQRLHLFSLSLRVNKGRSAG